MHWHSVGYADDKTEANHDLENAGEYYRGRVVSKANDEDIVFGHIMGFDRNVSQEVTITVLWEGGEQYSVHPKNLQLH